MMPLWTGTEIAQATGGELTQDFDVTGISIDTRTIEPGDLFVALTAERDGHDFVAMALEKGACGAMVARVPKGVPGDAPLCIVSDVLGALEDLARAARKRMTGKVAAITGSAGKTSTKDMAISVLSAQGRTHGSEASYNNHWGVPLTLARMAKDTEFAVIEIGMNHPGEIAPLAKIAAPDVAVITTVAAAHLEAFSGIEAIAAEKAAIFEGLRPGGTAILNVDLPVSGILRSAATDAGAVQVGFGEDPAATFRAVEIFVHDDLTVINAETPNGVQLFKIRAQGTHFAINALAVLAMVEALGGDPVLGATDLAAWAPPAGRGERVRVQLDPMDDDMTVDLIDDAYNANPLSMVAGLRVLAATKPRDGVGGRSYGRRIAVLGDMLELGSEEVALHAAISDLDEIENIDQIHCVGPLMRHLFETLPTTKRGHCVQRVDELIDQAGSLVDAGDVILIKGSKSSHVSKVVDAIKKLGHPRPRQEG